MEEIDELRAKAIASMPSSANPSSSLPKAKSPDAREEGELSSGEDTELPSCSAPSNNTALDEPIPATASWDNLTQKIKAVNNFPASGSSMANKHLRTSITRNYSKHFKAKQAPFKSSNYRTLSWHGKGSDDNLVISFSDDDSGSDSEESKLEKNVNRKDNRAAKSKMPMASSRTQPKVLRGPPTNRTKLMLNKGFVSHAPVSSIIEVRGASFVHPIASSVEKDPQTRRHNPVIKSSASQEHEHVQDANLADHRLESLRHQIAVRENELKVHSKSMPQSKERITGSYSDQNGRHIMKLDTQAAGFSRPTSVPTIGSTPNTQPMKRLKLDEHSKSRTCSDGQLQMQMPSTRSISELIKVRNAKDCHEGEKENFIGRTDPSPDRQHQKANRDDAISSKALLNGMKDNESLLLTTSATVRNLEVPSKHDSIFIADVSRGSHQRDMRAIPVDSSSIENQTLCLTQIGPNMDDGALCQDDTPIRRNPSSETPRRSNTSRGADVPNMLRNKATKTDGSNHIFEKYSVHITDRHLGNDEMNISGMGSMHLESLVELEELQDKELEDAQELRRRCELEERRALKAYRKAQRALVDANERCTHLYRKRELFSSQLRALILEASSSMWPSSWQNQKGTVLDSAKTVPSTSSVPLSSLGHQMPSGQILDRLGCEYNDQCPDGAYQRICGHEFGSEQCSEPDASTSEPRDNSAVNDICAAANHNLSTYEDDVNFPSDRRSVESILASDVNGGNHGGKTIGVNVEREGLLSSEIAQDYELLEATLRSKLVARLGTVASSKINDANNAECTIDKGAGSIGENKKPSASLEQRLQEGEDKLTSNLEGIERSGGNNDQLTAQFHYQSHGNSFSLGDESHRNVGPEENSSFPKKFCWSSETAVSSLPSSALRVVSRHAKFILPGCCSGLPETEEKGYISRISAKEVSEHVPHVVGESTDGYCLKSARTGEMDSDMCDVAIDPFRPFCMFELRGKCNNEECSWQHVKNYAKGNSKNGHPATSSSDGWVGHSLTCGKSNEHGLCHQILPVPTYQIGSSLINVDSHLSRSVLARSNWLYWQRGFCASFPLPFSVQRILPPNAPFLQSGDGPVADDYSRNGLSSYFQSQDGTVKQFKQGLPDPEQSLEIALDLFDGKVYKPDRKKALSLLSRAIEADPNSVVLWVVYLHIFYRKEKGIGKDDMFFHAVQHNEGSYELWLMYINSRKQLGDMLNAYDNCLNLFCQRKDTFDKDSKYSSACILDIFLQMIDFLCMSGNVDKAVSRIYGLLPTTHFENSGDTLPSDVHSCLIVSDKCVFWFCCVYLVIYGKLPEPIVQKFEFEKDLPFEIEWPSAQLTTERKDQALELMKFAVDNMASSIDVDSNRTDQITLRSLHFLAISHIRCVAALEGLHSSADLLVKYMKLYPTCIELVLISARLQENCTGDDAFRGFEEALCNWPKENSGLQCLWNQYAEHALEHRGFDFAEKLMARWFQGFWKGRDPCSENLDGRDGSSSSSELLSDVQSDDGSHSLLDDDNFGYLNLFFYRMLHKNIADARLAIDKALELAAPKNYKQCVREHAAFILSNESDSESISVGVICSLLNGYLGDSRTNLVLEPLSRRYYQTIKKSRTRQLINNILGPVSMDFSLVNAVLEVCYGTSLIPEKISEPKDLVDFVEPLMEMSPANYELALSVYRFTSRNFDHTGVTSNAIRFWASSILVNSISQAVPVAPEHAWLEAANVLRNLENSGLSLRFHQQAVSVYPFSIKLWQSYLDLSRMTGNTNAIVEAARERGVEL